MRGSLLGDSWEKNFHGLKKMPGESHLSYKCHHHAWMWGLDLWQPPRLQPEVRASIGAGKSQRNQRSGAVALPSSPWTPTLTVMWDNKGPFCSREFESKFSVTFNQKYPNWYKYHLLWRGKLWLHPKMTGKWITCSKLHCLDGYDWKIHVNANEAY